MTKRNSTVSSAKKQVTNKNSLRGTRLTQEEFLQNMRKVHPNLDFSRAEYISTRKKVVVGCKEHGWFEKSPNKLSTQGCPTCSKLSKIKKKTVSFDEFVSRAEKVHEGKYTYCRDSYTGTGNDKGVRINCQKHGWYYQNVKSHLKGYGCTKCSGSAPIDFDRFVERATEVHKGKFKYPKQYICGGKDRVRVICPKHGEYEVLAQAHLNGSDCSECAHLKSFGFRRSSFIETCRKYKRNPVAYVIRIYGHGEKFYKIGITSIGLEKRFEYNLLEGYSYEKLYVIDGNPGFIYDLEKRLHSLLWSKKHKPKVLFQGYTECFTTIKPIEKLVKQLQNTEQLQLLA